MPLILGIIFLIFFLGLSPKIMRKIVLLDVALCAVCFIALRVVASLFSATKGNVNAGMFSEQATWLVVMFLSVPALMLLGIVLGVLGRFVKPKTERIG